MASKVTKIRANFEIEFEVKGENASFGELEAITKAMGYRDTRNKVTMKVVSSALISKNNITKTPIIKHGMRLSNKVKKIGDINKQRFWYDYGKTKDGDIVKSQFAIHQPYGSNYLQKSLWGLNVFATTCNSASFLTYPTGYYTPVRLKPTNPTTFFKKFFISSVQIELLEIQTDFATKKSVCTLSPTAKDMLKELGLTVPTYTTIQLSEYDSDAFSNELTDLINQFQVFEGIPLFTCQKV